MKTLTRHFFNVKLQPLCESTSLASPWRSLLASWLGRVKLRLSSLTQFVHHQVQKPKEYQNSSEKRMKPTKEQAQKWANALRSGKYKQTDSTLQDSNGYCCLGVACELFIPKHLQSRGTFGYLAGSLPHEQPSAPDWLTLVNLDLEERLGYSFSWLNDDDRFTFDMIADIIELVYVHDAL